MKVRCLCYVQVEAINQMEGSYFGEGLTLLGEKWVRKNVGCNLFVLLILQIGDLSFLMTVIQTSFFS